MHFQVVRANVAHVDALARLFDAYRQFYGREEDTAGAAQFLRERMENDESVQFIALDEQGAGLGFTQLYPLFTSVGMRRLWLLNDLYVSAGARRLGVANALMNAARDHAVATGAAAILLETGIENHPAQRLYEKLGYRRNEATWYYELALN